MKSSKIVSVSTLFYAANLAESRRERIKSTARSLETSAVFASHLCLKSIFYVTLSVLL